MAIQVVKRYTGFLKKAFLDFNKRNGLQLSASLSYYTVFSICPFLIVVISLAGIFFGQQAVEGKVYSEISGLVGENTALQIQAIIQNIQKSHHSFAGGVIGFVVLIIGASGVFSEIQDSLNFIWGVKNRTRNGWLKFLTNRLLAFSLLAGVAFIMLVSLIINAILDILSERIKLYFPGYSIHLFLAFNIVLIFFVITTLFASLFKILPNASIRWKDAIVGAAFTALLFLLGKFAIGFYLGNSRIGITYGATASIILIMLWVYYSSIILYFGACFTKIYAIAASRKKSKNAEEN
jgi:membrane protein